jgi:Tfp pilus assembly protein PilW
MERRLLREEGGFTLAEVLVTMTIMIVVLFALYSIFDMSLRVFGLGNDKVEATANARIGLDKMAREIRAAYPYDKPNGNRTLFPSYGPNPSTSLTFGNDLNGDRRVDPASEQITYSLSAGSPATLLRNGQPVVEYVKDVDGGGALTFEYLQADGVTTATSETNVALVRMKLEVSLKRGIHNQPVTQILETDVALRNRVG